MWLLDTVHTSQLYIHVDFVDFMLSNIFFTYGEIHNTYKGIEGWIPSPRQIAMKDFQETTLLSEPQAPHMPPPSGTTLVSSPPVPPSPAPVPQVPQPATNKRKHQAQPTPTDAAHSLSPNKKVKLDLTASEKLKAITAELHADTTFPKEIPVKETIGKCSLMFPRLFAACHPASSLLQDYSDNGCPVDCGEDWTLEKILALMEKGPHKSATANDAIKQLRAETTDKIANGYARIIKWGDIKSNIPKKLKISPVAMIPHKSKMYRCILDLSFTLYKNGKAFFSVNTTTNKLAKKQSMVQLGSSLKRLVATMATHYHPQHPFRFAKLDIKDGFWRVKVSDDDAWNFAYVLPSIQPLTSIDDTELVIPNSLQMGWCESPPLFCTCSETARDIIDIIYNDCETLPAHKLEDSMLNHIREETLPTLPTPATAIATITEVFVDDFIGMTNDLSPKNMLHLSRSMLHGIHSVFPPPEVTGHTGGDSISEKKIAKGEGTWDGIKEILGWLFDGNAFTLQLPPEKCDKIVIQINSILKKKRVSLNTYQKLAGKLQHASFGIPGGPSLFSPIQRAMLRDPEFINLSNDLTHALVDWRYIIKFLKKHPTSVRQLVQDYPNFIAYTDACKLGCGGIWTSGTSALPPFLWQVAWPEDIQKQFVSDKNPEGTITINDLELCGIVLGWLALESSGINLANTHIATFCDNTSAVSWVYKLRTSTSLVAGRLLRILGMRIHAVRSSNLSPLHVAGENNGMADCVSRAFRDGKFFHASHSLCDFFTSNFPLPQTASWQECTLPPEWTSRVISCLRGEQLPLGSLLRLPKPGKNTGITGVATPQCAASTLSSPTTSQPSNATSLSLLSLRGCGQARTAEELKSEFRESRMPSHPSPRPSNWLDNKVPYTEPTKNIPSP